MTRGELGFPSGRDWKEVSAFSSSCAQIASVLVVISLLLIPFSAIVVARQQVSKPEEGILCLGCQSTDLQFIDQPP